MATFKIASQSGIETTYSGDHIRFAFDALDAMSRDAGYDGHDAACKVTGENPDDWTTDETHFKHGKVALLVQRVDG